jgi:hypothetical protein
MERKGKGKGEAKKKPFENKPSLSKDSEKVDCQMAATCSTSGVTGSSEPSLTDIMGVLMTIQNEQNTDLLVNILFQFETTSRSYKTRRTWSGFIAIVISFSTFIWRFVLHFNN